MSYLTEIVVPQIFALPRLSAMYVFHILTGVMVILASPSWTSITDTGLSETFVLLAIAVIGMFNAPLNLAQDTLFVIRIVIYQILFRFQYSIYLQILFH